MVCNFRLRISREIYGCITLPLSTEGKGNSVIDVLNSKEQKSSITIQDVYFIPSITSHVLLVKKVADKGFSVNFSQSACNFESRTNLFIVKQHEMVHSTYR